MSTQRTPVAWLRVFEIAARHLSFSATADELRVTPSAVSQQVRLLEHRLGKELFRRHARGLSLTVAGEALVPVCRESFDRLDAALAELFEERRDETLAIRVALGFARTWLLGKLASFSAANPDLQIRLIASVWAGEPLDPDIQVDLRLASGPITNMEAHQLTHDEIFPACSPALAKEARLNEPTGLSHYPLLHSIGFLQGWPHWLREASVRRTPLPSDIEFDSMQLSAEMAATGYGVALVRSSYAQDLLDGGRLTPLFDVRLPAKDNIFIVHAPDSGRTSPTARFRDWLMAT